MYLVKHNRKETLRGRKAVFVYLKDLCMFQAISKRDKTMEIKDFNELNALLKLLLSLKTSDNLDSFEVDLFAGSPFINDILKRVRQEYISVVRQKLGDRHADKWLSETKFTMDSEIGKAIQTRIQKWDSSIINNLNSKTSDDFAVIAKNYIEPLDYEKQELDKLIAFIARRLNASI